MSNKIPIDSVWINNHTNSQCQVKSKCFYNIGVQHYSQSGEPIGNLSWIHYKTFKKHWKLLGE